MRRNWDKFVRALVWFHRWLGLATCLIFALWFASGAVLLFVPFPSLPSSESKALGGEVAIDKVRVSPGQALALAGGGVGLRLRDRAGEPVYVVEKPDKPVIVSARRGAVLPLLSPASATGILGTRSTVSRTEGPFDYDQWVVHNQFDPVRPFYRISFANDDATQFYVSARTGEVVQRTTGTQRTLNWVGAVLHWAYITPLRSSFTAWDQTVWWLSFIAMWVAVAGMALGIIRTVAVRSAGRPGLTFYRRRWMRWHHLAGLFAGVFVLTWIFSGWLSMDHGRLFSRGQATAAQEAAYAGLTLEKTAQATSIAALRTLPPAREIRLTAIAGMPLLVLADSQGRSSLRSATGAAISDPARAALIARGIASAWGGGAAASKPVRSNDFYSLAEGMPATAVMFAGDGARPTIYVDGANGQIVTVMDISRAAYAWAYYGLHSFNVPGLADHPVLRDIIVLVPLLAGFLFSVTGVVLSWQRLRKSSPFRRGAT